MFRKRGKNIQIFKIQKPMAGNFDTPELLAYNKDRSIECFIPMEQADINELFGDTLKQYWKGRVVETPSGKNLLLEEQVKEQNW